MITQIIVGLRSGSLALLSDAGHMATDALGVTMALVAATLARRAHPSPSHTFGLHRLEILAALANAVLLVGVAAYVLIEAVARLGDTHDLDTGPVLAVGVVGLAANLVGVVLLRGGAAHSLNVRGAYLEVAADALGSVAVIAATLVVWATGWMWMDAAAAVGIAVFVVPRSLRLARSALRVLVEAAPPHLDPDAITSSLCSIPGVRDVHDLHIWTLTSGKDVLMAHLTVDDEADTSVVLAATRALLADQYGIAHATLQLEQGGDACTPCTW